MHSTQGFKPPVKYKIMSAFRADFSQQIVHLAILTVHHSHSLLGANASPTPTCKINESKAVLSGLSAGFHPLRSDFDVLVYFLHACRHG